MMISLYNDIDEVVMKYSDEYKKVMLGPDIIQGILYQYEHGIRSVDDIEGGIPPLYTPYNSIAPTINQMISDLGGKVYVKVGNKSMMDSVDTVGQGHYESAKDILLGILYSNRLLDTLSNAPAIGIPLTLKPYWPDAGVGIEYRCFIRSGSLVAISQRYIDRYNPYLQAKLDTIQGHIDEFMKEFLPEVSAYPHLYVDIIMKGEDYLIDVVDIEPWNSNPSDALLFSWDELWHTDHAKPLFRIADAEDHVIQPKAPTGMPLEFLSGLVSLDNLPDDPSLFQ